MKYHTYRTIYNYLLSDWTKEFEPFQDVRLYLTNTDDASTFEPKNRYYISYSANSAHFLNTETDTLAGIKNQADVKNENKLKNKELFGDSDTTGDMEPTGSYEQMLKEPASAHADKCPFIKSYKGRARNEARVNGEGEITDKEATRRCFPWKSVFDEDEYDKFSIPMTSLNQSTTCLTADQLTVSAKEKFKADGALLTVKLDDNLFPIEFITWDTPGYYNQYIFDWNPNGVFRVK